MTQHIKDSDFEREVLKAPGLVVIDFWAEWCGPCKAMSPVVDEVGAELGDKVKMVKMNVDDNPNTPTQFNIRGIPTLIAFKNGQPVATKVGGMSKSQLTAWLAQLG